MLCQVLALAAVLSWSGGSGGCAAHYLPALISTTSCDRFSLEALLYQSYLPRMENNLKDLSSLVSSALDSTLDSVQQLMDSLPGKMNSDREDFRVRASFQSLKRGFEAAIKKSKKNIIKAWDQVLQANLRFLDRTNDSPKLLLEAFRQLSDTYEKAGGATMKQLAVALLDPLKLLLKNSVKSLDQMKKDANVLKEIMPNFVGRLTGLALDRELNLDRPVKVPERLDLAIGASHQEWFQLLAADLFAVRLLETDLRVLLSDRRSSSPERLELSRRDLVLHWSFKAQEEMTANRTTKDTKDQDSLKEPEASPRNILENQVVSLIQLFE